MALTRRVEMGTILPVSIGEAWDLLSDTNRLNRLTGFPLVHFSDAKNENGDNFREAEIRLGKFVLARYREFPFDWIREKSYSVLRRFHYGPINQIVMGIEIESRGANEVELRAYGDVSIRWKWLTPLVLFIMKKGARDVLSFCDDYCERRERSENFFIPREMAPLKASRDWKAAEDRLREAIPEKSAIVDRFNLLLKEGNDEEVTRMRPFALADQWRANRDETLGIFLKATTAGLLDLEWELMCPSCRVPKETSKSLATLEMTAHCDLCGIEFEGDFDQYIELRFSVSPQIREASTAVFCIGAPSNTPHILAQSRVESGGTFQFSAKVDPEEFRVRVLGTNESYAFLPTGNTSALDLEFDGTQWTGNATEILPGLAELTIKNAGPRPIVVALERVMWDKAAVTAAYVTTLQQFRSSFSSEVLGAGRQVSIRTLTVLFSDLKDSTALYERVGDAPAFGRVQQHFEFMFARVQENQGAVVKTMGDAVMAVFSSPTDAIQAAISMQAGIEGFCHERKISPALILKLGVHNGPAVALNAAGKLDYFGRTINIAARTQAQSKGTDIVVSEAMLAYPGVAKKLASADLVGVQFRAKLKGIEGEVTLCRCVRKDSVEIQAA